MNGHECLEVGHTDPSGMLAKLRQGLFSLHTKTFSRNQVAVSCQPGIDLCQVIFRASADDSSHLKF